MSFSIKKDEKDARERLRAFWAGSSLGRPALYVVAKKADYRQIPWDRPELSRKELDFLPDWHAWHNDDVLRRFEYLAEAMPAAAVNFAGCINMPSLLIGGDYDYQEAGNAWIREYPDFWDNPLPVFDPEHPVVKALVKCYDRVIQTVGDRGFINPPVMMGALSTISEYRKPERFCIDLYENSEKLKIWIDAITTVLIDAYEYFYLLLKKNGYGDTSSWLHAMAEGKYDAVECDAGVMISPEMFKEFAVPALERLTEYYDYSLYHLDGTSQLRFLDLLSSLPGLNGIQWNPEPGSGSPVEWLDAFKEIRKRKLCLHIWCMSVEEAMIITKELGPDGLILVLPCFETVEEAEDAIRKIQKIC